MLNIRHLNIDETLTLEHDVAHGHPEWVHEQCGTDSGSALQYLLDQLYIGDYLDGNEDACGISADIPADAVAFKFNDPIEDWRWIYDEAEALGIVRIDASLITWVHGYGPAS